MSPKSDPTFVKSGLLLTKDLKLNIKNQDKKDAKLKFLKNDMTYPHSECHELHAFGNEKLYIESEFGVGSEFSFTLEKAK